MTVLPELEPLLTAVAARPAFDYSRPAAELRAESADGAEAFRMFFEPIPELASVHDDAIAVQGRSIPVRVYRPAPDTRLPALLYLHGGGWWLGDLEMSDPVCRKVAQLLRRVVVSVDYRLAPEHPYPAALEDAYAAVQWVAQNADALAIDAGDVAVGGGSAGGNLAAAVALLCRDRSGPPLSAQWLDIPATDLTMPEQPSLVEFGAGFGLDTTDMHKCVEFYAPDGAEDPYVSPLRATDLSGLPPAVVTTAECDPLRDQGEAYAARLQEAGVDVRVIRSAGHLHGTTLLSALTPTAAEFESRLAEGMASIAKQKAPTA